MNKQERTTSASQNKENNQKIEHENVHNKFTIRGTVVNKRETATSMSLCIRTSAFLNYIDHPWVVIFDAKLIERFNRKFKLGDRITVKGFVLTSKKRPDGSLVVTDIAKEYSRMDVAFGKGRFNDDKNQVAVSGTLFATPRVTPKAVLFNVKTKTPEGAIVFLPVVAFGAKAKIAQRKTAGSNIRVLCFIKTQELDGPEDKRSEQSFVLQDIE